MIEFCNKKYENDASRMSEDADREYYSIEAIRNYCASANFFLGIYRAIRMNWSTSSYTSQFFRKLSLKFLTHDWSSYHTRWLSNYVISQELRSTVRKIELEIRSKFHSSIFRADSQKLAQIIEREVYNSFLREKSIPIFFMVRHFNFIKQIKFGPAQLELENILFHKPLNTMNAKRIR